MEIKSSICPIIIDMRPETILSTIEVKAIIIRPQQGLTRNSKSLSHIKHGLSHVSSKSIIQSYNMPTIEKALPRLKSIDLEHELNVMHKTQLSSCSLINLFDIIALHSEQNPVL